ncbi:FtsX-like permease family protein [Micromonospora sp. NPDC049679]|uniref:FtsX-like permease family protein n=1 Tax=Micromonospora sp. NPDC049679 TaxID=3155920 RepID=UPI0033C427C6
MTGRLRGTSAGGIGAWRAALRISVREARRAKGRNALVLAMIALPVLALSFVAVTYDMFHLGPAEQIERELGTADAQLRWVSQGPVQQDTRGEGWSSEGGEKRTPTTTADILAALPAGSRAIRHVNGRSVGLRTASGIAQFQARGIDLADPLAHGMVRVLAGRAPVGGAEIALSEQAADRLRAGLGERVTGGDRSPTYTVVAVVEWTDNLRELVVLPPEAMPEPADGGWLVDTPAPVSWAQVGQLNQRGLLVKSRAVLLDPPPAGTTPFSPSPDYDTETVGSVLLVGGLGLLEVVLLAGPAFAVGARRRQRDLALVAANGGAPAHLRRLVLADGVVLGSAGAVVGIVLGVIAAAAGRPIVEQYLVNARAGGYRFFPLALLGIAVLAVITGVLAALVPAYTAARQEIVTTLGGRRGVIRSRKRWLVLGAALAATGSAVAVYGASDGSTNAILAGVVLAELGLVLCTPSLVGLIARLGRVLPLAPRIALRDTARNRAAAAPAISAVMAAVAGSVALATFLTSEDLRQEASYQPALPPGYVSVMHGDQDRPLPPERVRVLADASIALTDVAELRQPACRAGSAPEEWCGLRLRMPAAQVCPLRRLGRPPTAAEERAAATDHRCRETGRTLYEDFTGSATDDGTALPILTGLPRADLAGAAQVLRASGIVVSDARFVVNGTVTVDVVTGFTPEGEPVRRGSLTVPGYALTNALNTPTVIYSPGLLAKARLTTRQVGFALATGATPTVAQEERLRQALVELSPRLYVQVERGRPSSNQSILIVLAIAAGLVTVGAAGIATGLAAAESRADLSTLAAIGASPSVRRLLSLSQAGVIAGLGSLLGILAGLIAGLTILAALDQAYVDTTTGPTRVPYPLVVPWTTLAVLVVVPVVAMLGAGLLTRSRLPIERRLA